LIEIQWILEIDTRNQVTKRWWNGAGRTSWLGRSDACKNGRFCTKKRGAPFISFDALQNSIALLKSLAIRLRNADRLHSCLYQRPGQRSAGGCAENGEMRTYFTASKPLVVAGIGPNWEHEELRSSRHVLWFQQWYDSPTLRALCFSGTIPAILAISDPLL
jgi:hypothetical protein